MNLQHAVQHSLNVSLTRFYTNKPAGTRRLTPTPGLFRHCPCRYNHNQEPKECVHSHLWTLETLTPYLHQLSACAQTHFRCTKKGEGPIFKYIGLVLNLKTSFLPVKTSTFNHPMVWNPKNVVELTPHLRQLSACAQTRFRCMKKGGGANIQVLNLKTSFLAVKTSTFHHAMVWSPKNVVERPNRSSCALFWQLGPSPSTSTSHPPDVIRVMNAPRSSQF